MQLVYCSAFTISLPANTCISWSVWTRKDFSVLYYNWSYVIALQFSFQNFSQFNCLPITLCSLGLEIMSICYMPLSFRNLSFLCWWFVSLYRLHCSFLHCIKITFHQIIKSNIMWFTIFFILGIMKMCTVHLITYLTCS